MLTGTLVERSLIAKEMTSKMPLLLEILNTEMDNAKESFDEQEVKLYSEKEKKKPCLQARVSDIGKALMDRNMPPVAGQLSFSQELR